MFRRQLNKVFLNNLTKLKLKWNRGAADAANKTLVNISDPVVQCYLQNIRTKYKHKLVPDHISALIESVNERDSVLENLKNLEDLQRHDKDDDMKELVKEERELYEQSLKFTNEKILDSMFPDTFSYRSSDCIIEIIAGVGGLEAMLFCDELLNMYLGFANYRGWSAELIQRDETPGGGVRHASVIVSGPGALEILRLEAGVHRVQRVPATERSGRLHTSTVSVAVMLQPSEIDIKIADSDLKIDTKTSSGAGGQNVNKLETCVRITHIPTGTVVECQTEREQHKNRKNAMARLRAILYQKQEEKLMLESKQLKKSQIGTGSRNEKIRTYNFNQDRVSDHRIGGSQGTFHDLPGILEGGSAFYALAMKLQKYEYTQNVLQQIESLREEMKTT